MSLLTYLVTTYVINHVQLIKILNYKTYTPKHIFNKLETHTNTYLYPHLHY